MGSMSGQAGRVRAGTEIAVWAVVLLGITVVSISSVSAVELLVAGIAALGSAFAARRVRLAAGADLHGVRGVLRATLALPWAVARGMGLLVAALARRPRQATVRRIRLRPDVGGAWAAALIAASPDTCVIDAQRDDEVLVHALPPGTGPVEKAVARAAGER